MGKFSDRLKKYLLLSWARLISLFFFPKSQRISTNIACKNLVEIKNNRKSHSANRRCNFQPFFRRAIHLAPIGQRMMGQIDSLLKLSWLVRRFDCKLPCSTIWMYFSLQTAILHFEVPISIAITSQIFGFSLASLVIVLIWELLGGESVVVVGI